MRITQKLLCLNFSLSYLIETLITCFAYDLFIKTLGPEHMGIYFTYSAITCIGLVLLSLYISKMVSSVKRFIGLHAILAMLALICLLTNSSFLQARIVFIAMFGFNLLIYFSNWSIANLFVTPFESKRLFPIISAYGHAGIFIGSLIAIVFKLDMDKTYYFAIWFIAKLGMIGAGAYLKTARTVPQNTPKDHFKYTPGLFQILKSYKLVPRLTLWTFVWGIVFGSTLALLGTTFNKSGVNLVMLYGVLSLAGAFIAIFSSTFAYPKIVKWLKLGTMLFVLSLLSFVSGGIYLLFDTFVIGVVVYLIFNLVDDDLIMLTLSREFCLYPFTERDQIRLFGEILANSAGIACVGLVFIMPTAGIRWFLGVLLLMLFIIGFFCRQGFVWEILRFLRSKDHEEQNNAISLFDMVNEKNGYDKMLDILMNDPSIATRSNIIETFAYLGTSKPASAMIKILNSSETDALRIAVLRYLENIRIDELDPFLQFEVVETLQNICRSQSSNILRAMAIKLFVQNGSPDKTVKFIMDELRNNDERAVANAIEGLAFVNYPGVIEILLPFLKQKNSRIRANCIVTLWKYADVRDQLKTVLGNMLISHKTKDVVSGVWAAGEIKDVSWKNHLIGMLDRKEKELERGIPIALLKLGCEEYASKVVDIILGKNEKQAINACYLSLRIDKRIHNEKIIASIFEKGNSARELAIKRYSQCGGFCRELLDLLRGRTNTYQ